MMSLFRREVQSVAETPHEGQQSAHDQGAPVPKFLLLVYLIIGIFFVSYLATQLKFGAQSPTGF